MDKFLGLKIEYVLIFVILGLLYFTLGKCNCDRFSVGGQTESCDKKKAECMSNKRCINVDFSGCDLSTVDLTNFQMNGANLKGTKLSGFLEGTNLYEAAWDKNTKWETKSLCNDLTNFPFDIRVGDFTRHVSCIDGVVVVTETKHTPPNNICHQNNYTCTDKSLKCCYHKYAPDSCCKQNQECGEHFGCNNTT
jgi:hypothetical protein